MLLDELFNDQVFLPVFGEREDTVTDAKGRSYVAVAHPGPRTLGQKFRDPSRLFTIELYPIVKGQRARSRIGWVNFARVEDHLEAEDVYIEPRYRRRGLATAMYQLARKLGNDIQRSSKQTGMGREFWATKSPVDEEQLDELSFLGSQCTKDCSGHRAGYEWYKRKQRPPMSWSPSFNKGAALAQAGK